MAITKPILKVFENFQQFYPMDGWKYQRPAERLTDR